MKRILLLLVPVLFYESTKAQNLPHGDITTDITATEEGYNITVGIRNVLLKNDQGWSKVNIAGTVNTLDAGAPQMPYKSFSLLLPEGAVELNIKNRSYTDYFNYDIIPSKGNLDRTEDPSKIPLVKGPEYNNNAFYPTQVAEVANDYMIRTAHGRAIHFFPVQYNPVTHTVRIYHSLEIEVKTKKTNKPAEAMTNRLWDNVYKHQFLNYDLLTSAAAKSTYSAPTETGDMLIVTPGQYINALQSFINWKMERGIRCYVMNMDTLAGGNDADSIQARIAYHYQQNSSLNYVLLVGDESDIEPMVNSNLAGPSDAAYGYISGNDHYPDLLVGRFSANNLQELQPQITKSVDYERYPTATQSWYSRAMGIASNEGPGDDNQMDWEHMAGVRQQLLGATYSHVYEAYDGTHDPNIAPLDNPNDPNEQEVIDAINSGVSLINYCGHGSSTSMATTGFSNNDVADLTNTNGEWPFIITVACVTGEFMNGNTSLGEKMMTATQSGQAFGMVAGFMSSINQYWDPPMEAQDVVNGIITGNDSNQLYAAAAITAAGCMRMNDAYTNAGYDMTDTWIFFGDPSLQLRYQASDTLTALHADSLFFYEVNTAVQLNKEYGTVVLLHNDTIYAVETTLNYNTLHTFAALPAGDSLIVIATAPNTNPYFGKIRIVDTPATIPLNIVNVEQSGEIVLYPNPAHKTVSVKGLNSETTFRCIDMTGRIIQEGKLDKANNTVNTGNIPAGAYILQLETGKLKRNLPLQILR